MIHASYFVGGIAAFQSVKYGGIPLAHYQLAGRGGDGMKTTKLQAYGFHLVCAPSACPLQILPLSANIA